MPYLNVYKGFEGFRVGVMGVETMPGIIDTICRNKIQPAKKSTSDIMIIPDKVYQ
jgi:hypothetical protein